MFNNSLKLNPFFKDKSKFNISLFESKKSFISNVETCLLSSKSILLFKIILIKGGKCSSLLFDNTLFIEVIKSFTN